MISDKVFIHVIKYIELVWKRQLEKWFYLDCVYLLYYKSQEINLNCRELYLDSPDWIKKQNKNNKFCYK